MRISAGFAWAIGVLAMFAPAAMAQTWTTATVGADNSEWQIDVSRVKSAQSLVDLWVRQVMPGTVRDPLSHKLYRATVTHRLVNCAADSYVNAAVIELDERGGVVWSVQMPPAQMQFTATPPGSTGDVVNQKACAIVARRNALRPAIPVKPDAQAKWRDLGSSSSGIAVAVAMDSLQRHGAQVAYVERIVGTGTSPQGATYQTAMYFIVDDCERRQLWTLSVDLYDDTGALIEAQSQPLEQAQVAPVAPGTVGEAVFKVVCAPDQAAASAPPVEFGTAWEGPKGYLITAAHVVGGARRVALAQAGQSVGTAEVVADDPANDIAVLKPTFTNGAHVPLAVRLRPAALGEKVFTLGYPAPDLLGTLVKVTSGEISSVAGVSNQGADDRRIMQISAPVQPGNSGGPVIDNAGDVIGIVLARISDLGDGQTAENVNYAIKISYLRSLLDGLPDLGGAAPTRLPASRERLIDRLQSSVFLVVVEGSGG